MEYECPQDGQQLDVPNPYYGKFGENTDQPNASDSEFFEQNSLSHNQRTRKNTFPYVMENELSDSTINRGSPQDHWYQNVHGLCAAVNKPGKGATITMTTAPPTNEYDIIERYNTTSSTSPAVPKPKSSLSDDLVYSLASEPMEGEVYNVAYPVLTPKAENSVVVDGYECLSNVPS